MPLNHATQKLAKTLKRFLRSYFCHLTQQIICYSKDQINKKLIWFFYVLLFRLYQKSFHHNLSFTIFPSQSFSSFLHIVTYIFESLKVWKKQKYNFWMKVWKKPKYNFWKKKCLGFYTYILTFVHEIFVQSLRRKMGVISI